MAICLKIVDDRWGAAGMDPILSAPPVCLRHRPRTDSVAVEKTTPGPTAKRTTLYRYRGGLWVTDSCLGIKCRGDRDHGLAFVLIKIMKEIR
jgi:hypothetical protein